MKLRANDWQFWNWRLDVLMLRRMELTTGMVKPRYTHELRTVQDAERMVRGMVEELDATRKANR